MPEDLLPLTLRYRPRRFEDMVGQLAARVTLQRMIMTDRIPPALLLHGSWGSGKTTSARIVAAALNCEEEDSAQRPCGKCPTCDAVVDGKSSDVIEIDAASSGGAEEMRDLRQQVRRHPMRRYIVVLLDECHELTAKGQQTLLKVLEEPPPRVVFMLATTNVDRVLPTIASRCFSVRFQRIKTSDIAARVSWIGEREGFDVSTELASAIADRSQGALRDAVMLLDQCSLVGIATPDDLSVLLGDTDTELKILTALADGDLPAAFEACRAGMEALPSPSDLVARLVTSMRRLLVLTSLQGGTGPVPLSPPPTSAEIALAPRFVGPRLVAGMRAVWEYYASIAPAADAYAAMDLLIVMLGAALSGGQPAASKSVPSVTSVPVTSKDSRVGPNTPAGPSSPAATADDLLARYG
ncbi:MAG: DNA polymerase III subunit gamma/tau [Candidatus Nanopelagicales bacterium]